MRGMTLLTALVLTCGVAFAQEGVPGTNSPKGSDCPSGSCTDAAKAAECPLAPLPGCQETSLPPDIHPDQAACEPDPLQKLASAIELLENNLTVTTGNQQFKVVLGGLIVADCLYSTNRLIAPGTPALIAPDSAFGFYNESVLADE